MQGEGSIEDEGTPVSGLMHGGRPAPDDVQLKRQVLLARLFPQRRARPRLGRYDVLEFVGEGGMGTVFAAYDPQLDRRVAVKLLRQVPGAEAQGRARMLREAKALARLSHPNIVTIHEVWEEGGEDGEVCLAMEYVQGQTLAQWQRTPQAWRAVVDAYRQAGEGLAAAHAAGLVYRDFKPHNAILREDGVVKVLDFGLARIDAEPPESLEGQPTLRAAGQATDSESQLTRPGAIMGTPAYMAPEQRAGAAADARSDQFGFCVALWEGLHGELPFSPSSSPSVEGGEPEALRRREPSRDRGIPSWVGRVLDRGLALEPAARYPSMRALLSDLGRDPAAQRRRALAIVAGLVAAVGGGLVIAELRAEPATSCVDARRWWGADERDAVRQGVLQGGGAAADQTWALLSPRLDHHAERLVQLRQQACESHRRGLLPAAHHDLQVACLDRRAAGFDELVGLLTRGDAAAVANANKAVAELLSPDACTDTEALLAEHPPPADPVVAARVAELRQALARAWTEESAGHHERAEARAAAVREEARRLGHPPLLAEALVRWGSAGMQAGREDAAARLDEALWLSIASEQRQVAAEAAAKRIFARVELLDRTADVTEAIALAQSLVERAGAADWRTRWVLDNNVAIARERSGQRSEALAAFEAALAHVPADAPGSFERAVTLLNMAPMQVRLGQSVRAEGSARAAVVELAALFGAEHPQLRVAQASLASVLRTIGRYAEARSTLAAVLERFSQSDPPPLWMVYEAAQIAWAQGDHAGVRSWHEHARPRLGEPEGEPSLWPLAFALMEARVRAAEGDTAALAELDALAPGLPPPLRMFVALGRAEVLLALGHATEADVLVRPIADDASAAEADGVTARLLLARSLVAREQWQAARDRLVGLVEGDDEGGLEPLAHAQALRALSAAETGLGRADRALAHAEQALAVLEGFDPESPAVREARAARERALAIGPG